MFSLRLCGEFPFGCGYAALCTLELPKIAAERGVPIMSAISTATRLTKVIPVSDSKPTWFFRAALSDRNQMHWLAQWLAGFRALKPDEISFVFKSSNEFVKNSSKRIVERDVVVVPRIAGDRFPP